jgi:two-component system CheB/CheR fusion protein
MTKAPKPSSPAGEHPSIVGVGASAGGLEACRTLFAALPAGQAHRMAFILVQHLDPTHASLIVELLSGHTALKVVEAEDGMEIERDHLYVIPPGAYLSVAKSRLRLSVPLAPHGSRLPFDFLLQSMARDTDTAGRAVCVILSGTGTDGTLGARAIREAGGLVIAQDPDEAGYGGMPRSAIQAGVVDLSLALADMPAALEKHLTRPAHQREVTPDAPAIDKDAADEAAPAPQSPLAGIVDLLRSRTAHDFSLYKPGTLQRRTERRMAMTGIDADDMARYLDRLRADPAELALLANDLLINVTSFFRDAKVFDFLAEKTIPEMIARHTPDMPLRIWIAGCSTGEETYSLAMLFREEMARTGSHMKLQIFASDVDPDAVAAAREGLYAETIKADLTPERLSRFFSQEGHNYRISPDLRALVVFTVQDVLADPPFSRLDLISCRNLLIYLRPEAQAKVIALFHFALRDHGVLLLGASETVGHSEGRFAVISKPERLYRHVGRNRAGDLRFALNMFDVAPPKRRTLDHTGLRPGALAELCRRMVLEAFAPAAVLINRKNECLYFLGPTDDYLGVARGHALYDILAMARDGVRTKLRVALQQAVQENRRVVIGGGTLRRAGGTAAFRIDIQPVVSEGEELLLVCFIDEPAPVRSHGHAPAAAESARIVELEKELDATRAELSGAIRNLEISGEEQRAINEEALSVNEEFQSTNEEMVTSKEELQSLNEELTALNSQLQETLERQRTTANDLQNVLYSTDLATLFLDRDLKIRFFTPATKLLFRIIASDVGRPLENFSSLTADPDLLADARTVLATLLPIEREIEARTGAWYIRRILPYQVPDDGVEGVVITFADITERRKITDALSKAEQAAQQANISKSRFLAAASHDLRQPLQSLKLIQGLLARSVEGEKAVSLVTRFGDVLGAVSGMLNALLDINQIEAGTVQSHVVSFSIDDLLQRLSSEFAYHAQAQRLDLRVVPCHLFIDSDPRLLEQILRNLLTNALKYTRTGKVLMGCRRHGDRLSIEICDTGIGIPQAALQAIFEEYEQLDNPDHDRSRGLGLGLSIVKRLSLMLGHRVGVRSQAGKGSVFSIEVDRSVAAKAPKSVLAATSEAAGGRRTGDILVVEDDPEVRGLLDIILREDGHQVRVAADGTAALDLVRRTRLRPDLVIADYHLSCPMDGVELINRLRQALHDPRLPLVPAIILTGDMSTQALRDIAVRATEACLQLTKPVTLASLTQAVQNTLTLSPPVARVVEAPDPDRGAVVFVVDDDSLFRDSLRLILEDDGRRVEDFESCEAFLAAYIPGTEGCLLIDAYLPGMKGVDLLQRLRDAGHLLPSVMITGSSDVLTAVAAMRAGAADFIEKPASAEEVLSRVAHALGTARDESRRLAWHQAAIEQMAGLTFRQREIMTRVLAGEVSKNIAADLGISQRTVENHRNAIMKKTGARSLPALARLALAAAGADG